VVQKGNSSGRQLTEGAKDGTIQAAIAFSRIQGVAMDFAACRQQFPVTREFTFLNHAAVAAPPQPVVEAVASFLAECAARGSLDYGRWQVRLAWVRERAAELIGAAAEEIAFVPNTSTGLATVAEGLNWRPGEAVLVAVPDFPTNVYPWQHLERKGVSVRFIERRPDGRFGPEELSRALVPGARLLAVSSVDYVTGFAADLPALGEFCREQGLLLCVDAIQSLGVLPLDVKECGIHLLAAGGHKWLLGPMGSGLLFVDRGVADRFEPPLVGWKSVVDEENFEPHFDLKQDAGKFEPGTLNLPGIFGLGAALELLHAVGIANIRQRVLALNDRFAEGLRARTLEVVSPRGETERSGILSFRPPGDALHCFRFFAERKVLVSPRGGMIRLSPHFWNDESDVDAFFAALDAFGTPLISDHHHGRVGVQ
jgi:selenocysteine lyase/cysteine desulfurase